jgi:uncharacterized protein (TIGR02996 family)
MSLIPGFLQSILESPADDSARLILADWLQEQDDPLLSARAELIRLQCQLAGWIPDGERRAELQQREQELIACHGTHWLGELAERCPEYRWDRGLVRLNVPANRLRTRRNVEQVLALFPSALVQSVRLEGVSKSLPALLKLTPQDYLTDLDLDGNELDDSDLPALLASPHAERLVCLDLANNQLTTFSLRQLHAARMPRLTWLDLRNNRLDDAAVKALLKSPLARQLSWLDVHGNYLEIDTLRMVADWRAGRPSWGLPRITNSVGMDLVQIPAGSFLMGSPPDEQARDNDEGPQHWVTISRPFWLGVYAVTQQQYQRVMGSSPSSSFVTEPAARSHPVESVSWNDASDFCERLTALPAERAAGRAYRLPTEAEWEYAARAGTPQGWPFLFGSSLHSRLANFNGESPYGGGPRGPYLQRTTPVGSYAANPWGLYDIHGNVWEWCSDWYQADYYAHSSAIDPPGPARGERRVLRGGSWLNQALNCRLARRDQYSPDFRYNDNGFRVVLLAGP